jgi:hypothetical protein
MAFGFRDPVELLKLCLDESVARLEEEGSGCISTYECSTPPSTSDL